jgi:arsenite methyltransferase
LRRKNLPLPANIVDVIISNSVINLSGDKDSVLREAYRVLMPGGRFAISDIVVLGNVPADVRKNVELWTGCVAGALHQDEYRTKLQNAGFERVEIEPTRIYHGQDIKDLLAGNGLNANSIISQVDGTFASTFIRARKIAASCYGPDSKSWMPKRRSTPSFRR